MTDNVTRLPRPGVILDLDAEERPESEVKPPFVVTVGGKDVTLEDPANIDWKKLAAVDIPADLLHVAMSKEDRKHIFDTEMPGWKFNRFMDAYYNHYDLEEKIREAKQRQQFGA